MFSKILPIAALILGSTLYAQSAPPPIGNWSGEANGVANYPVYLDISRNGSCTLREPSGGVALSGVCTWNATASTGGILTLRYDTPTATQTFHNRLYLGVTWVDKDTIVVRAGSGPQAAGTLKRR